MIRFCTIIGCSCSWLESSSSPTLSLLFCGLANTTIVSNDGNDWDAVRSSSIPSLSLEDDDDDARIRCSQRDDDDMDEAINTAMANILALEEEMLVIILLLLLLIA
jgi:hypothetical protein